MRSAAAAMLDAERALDEIQRQFSAYPRFGARERHAPRIEARESENEFLISAELPGVQESEIKVSVEDGVLTLKREVEVAAESSEGSESDPPAEPERRVVFQRRIRFNAEIAEENVRAIYKNGLLTVTVPKREPVEPVEPEVLSIPVEVA